MKPITTICPKNYPGTSAVLSHYNVTGLVNHTDEISPQTVKGRKLIILGGWHPLYYEGIKRIIGANVSVAMFWTSSVGQTDFSNNGMEISYLHLIRDLAHTKLIFFVRQTHVKTF